MLPWMRTEKLSMSCVTYARSPTKTAATWLTLYNDTVVELDPIKLLDKIEVAQKAISDRLEDALHGRNPINANEQQLIEDARQNLHFLKKHPAA
jgi:hypothetical protein